MGIDAGGEAGTGEGKGKPQAHMPGAFWLGSMLPREHQTEKTPCRSCSSGGGLNTRAAWPYIHTARLGAGRRIHRSAPHGKGYCPHGSSYQEALELHTYC